MIETSFPIDTPRSAPETQCSSKFETVEEILSWTPVEPTTPYSETDFEKSGIRLISSSPDVPHRLVGKIFNSQIEHNLAQALKEISWKISTKITIESAKAQAGSGHSFPTDLPVGEYGGIVAPFIECEGTPITLTNEQLLTSDTLEARMRHAVGIQIRFPLSNPFRPRYELLAREASPSSNKPNVEHEALLWWAWCEMDFAKLICRWRGIIEEFPSSSLACYDYRLREEMFDFADAPFDTRGTYRRDWGKKSYRRLGA